ncbi:protein INSYN2B [Bufo gargarizans]|uniref:protein INSYN2B n=1 Tax=Bufo gargarizans TaxID=30331 RepID=UPI001CF3899D|nr:protein INSYN2B [Bufo gargarizans]XP_044136816.1 protein INSYN2B [Bufo gargarizans]XP_044136817.1 protein INSYN2B [Bufo gargarizans]XP_044136818.1 protein INSYN2B [Bufo gargarizans]
MPNVHCNSMEQQTMKVRSVLLKRKSFDTSDPTKQTNHHKSKSQQVRFKEDSTTQDAQDFVGLSKNHCDNISLINRKPGKSHTRTIRLLTCSQSQKGIQNIAIQTSPSLRKHIPNFKAKETTPKGILFTESSCAQVNGELSDDDIGTPISHLKLSDQFEEELKRVRRSSPLLHTVPKTQSNGPISKCSGLQFAEVLEQDAVSIHLPDNPIKNSIEETEKSNTDLQMYKTSDIPLECSVKSNINISQPSHVHVKPITSVDAKQAEIFFPLKQKVLLPKNNNIECKRILTLTPSFKSNLSYCFHSEHQQTDKSEKLQEFVLQPNHSHQQKTVTNLPRLQTKETDITGSEKNTTDTTGCTDSISSLPKIGIPHEANNKGKLTNPQHKSHSQFCSLQGKLQTVEESLQSNQKKIKILLNVIQDLEKARAFSEGRFYRTGQDLNNCSTCQSTACIIYSVEYDFRQQEERFLHILKKFDKVEANPILSPAPKPEPEIELTEKQEERKKFKKNKKKCFWWI